MSQTSTPHDPRTAQAKTDERPVSQIAAFAEVGFKALEHARAKRTSDAAWEAFMVAVRRVPEVRAAYDRYTESGATSGAWGKLAETIARFPEVSAAYEVRKLTADRAFVMESALDAAVREYEATRGAL